MDIYHHPKEKWSHSKCAKAAKHLATDGLGTPYPFKGYLGSSVALPAHFGTTIYNGGCVRNDKWYHGEHFPLPELAPGFKIIVVPTWGWRIVADGTKSLLTINRPVLM
jgi:hypothetical protein